MQKEEIRKNFAVMGNAYTHFSFTAFLDSICVLGLNKIDLWAGVPHLYAPDVDESELRRIRREIESRNITVVSYTPEMVPYPYDIAAEKGSLRTRTIEYLKRNMEIAASLEVPYMLLPAGRGLADLPREENLRNMYENLETLTAYAEHLSLELALEHLTVPSSPLINYAADLKAALDAAGSAILHAVLDLGQMSVFSQTVDDYHALLGDEIRIVHIMDGDPNGHLAFGDGCLPLETYYKQVRNMGFKDPVVLEINDRRYFTDPHTAIKQCLEQIETWE